MKPLFATLHYWFLPSARYIHLAPYYSTSFISIFNTIIPSTSKYCKWTISYRFYHQNPIRTFLFLFSNFCRMPCPYKPPWFLHPNNNLPMAGLTVANQLHLSQSEGDALRISIRPSIHVTYSNENSLAWKDNSCSTWKLISHIPYSTCPKLLDSGGQTNCFHTTHFKNIPHLHLSQSTPHNMSCRQGGGGE